MLIIVMGVSGSGKTTIGQKLAEALGLPFYDADDFHSPANIAKMRSRIPLTDDDRIPWLMHLANNLEQWERKAGAVLACSALKEQYRQILQGKLRANWICLSGTEDLIIERLQSRKNHFMSSAMLRSQLEALEKPAYGIHIDVFSDPDQIIQNILAKMKNTIPSSEIGILGLGVMGKSLALNLAGKGVRVALYNRHVPVNEEKVAEKIMADNPGLENLKGFDELPGFVQALAQPRKIILMIYAGAVDAQIDELIPLLEPGDIIIDGGNSNYKDTSRRAFMLAARGLSYLGAGISGGEAGARSGPSIMAGGDQPAYRLAERYFDLMAARDQTGRPCSAYIGPGGAGHFVKMVHNGIEYAEMQILSEIYYLLRYMLVLRPAEIVKIFRSWQAGEPGSYLLEITIDILEKREDGALLLDKILDKAAQKGTGGLSLEAALEYGVPYGPLAEAVMARAFSALKERRVMAAALYQQNIPVTAINREHFVSSLKNAYQAGRMINHEIGFTLLFQASRSNSWHLHLSEVARIWTNGCIIRSGLMEELVVLLEQNESILVSPAIVARMKDWRSDFAQVIAQAIQQGFAVPGLSSALNYFLTYITADSAANLIQAQRDYFGAHTYQRIDKPSDQYFHTIWTGLDD